MNLTLAAAGGAALLAAAGQIGPVAPLADAPAGGYWTPLGINGGVGRALWIESAPVRRDGVRVVVTADVRLRDARNQVPPLISRVFTYYWVDCKAQTFQPFRRVSVNGGPGADAARREELYESGAPFADPGLSRPPAAYPLACGYVRPAIAGGLGTDDLVSEARWSALLATRAGNP